MNKEIFYKELRKTLYKNGLKQSAVEALDAIIDETVGKNIPVAHVAYMMATAYHESGADLVTKSENLNYTTAARIRAVWPSRFASPSAAQPYVKQPQKLANFVYGGRLGNNSTGDGWKYRGRGHVQITGKVNYQKVSKYIGQDAVANPDLMLDVKNSVIGLVHCMIDGVYTGKKLSNFNLPSEYYSARQIINADRSRVEGGMRIGDRVAGYARNFESALKAANFEAGTVVKPKPAQKPKVENKPIEHATDSTPGWIQLILRIIAAIFKSK